MGCQRCLCCFRAAKWLPVLFIVAVVVWSYYAYVIQLCLFTVPNILEKVLYLLFYHAAFAMFCWAYWQTIFAEVGRVPKHFRISPADAEKLEKELTNDNQQRFLEHLARDLPVSNRTDHNGIRYCEKCHIVKPDRAHHCSVCGECILKMDHHCPWVNNCVNFRNYKFFILFLGYSLVYCIYVACTTLQYFIKFWKNELSDVGRFHILFLFFVSVMFAFSLVSLFGYHCYLVSVNRSTLESFRSPIFRTGPDKDGFSLGKYNNFMEVFGDNKRNWFLPIFSSLGDGIVFPTRTPQGNSYNSMGSTVASLGDGVTFPERPRREDTEGLLGNGQRWPESGEGDSCSEQENLQTNRHSLSSDTRLIVE